MIKSVKTHTHESCYFYLMIKKSYIYPFQINMSKSEQEYELFDPSAQNRERKGNNSVGDIVGVSFKALGNDFYRKYTF